MEKRKRGGEGAEKDTYVRTRDVEGEISLIGGDDYLVLFLSVGSSNEQPRFQICRNAYVIGDNVGGIDLRHDVPAKLKCIRLTFRITNSSCTPTVSPRGIDTSRFYRGSILALARLCVRVCACVCARLRASRARVTRMRCNPRKNRKNGCVRSGKRRVNGERDVESWCQVRVRARTLDSGNG